MQSLSPILLFTYRRVDTLKQTVASLNLNSLSADSDLYIFSDASKNLQDEDDVLTVRKYLREIIGFKKIVIYESDTNKGLANSIIAGVTKIVAQYGKVIVLEDDLVVSENFLLYMNQALCYYTSNKNVFSISGFSMPMKGILNRDIYFTKRASSWGWATWNDRWVDIDWNVKDYKQFLSNRNRSLSFDKMGSDMSRMLSRQMKGEINSWAIRWCYHQFKNDLYTVYPFISKVVNIGLEDPIATHTNEKLNRFKTSIDKSLKNSFNFIDEPYLEKDIIRQFIKPYSFYERVKYKIINLILFKL